MFNFSEITQISIYLKDNSERINEVALFEPLGKRLSFDEQQKTIQQRRWSYTTDLSLLHRASLKVQKFLYKRMPSIIPADRISKEAKFKTVVAILLSQESLREFFLSRPQRKKNFLQALQKTAHLIGYENFSMPSEGSTLQISQQLTRLKNVSLVDNLYELNLQMSALGDLERNKLLFCILNELERPPIQSVLEIIKNEAVENIALTTKYAKYKVMSWDKDSGKLSYDYVENQATSSIRTIENTRIGVKGAMNQRMVLDSENHQLIGTYCGELSSVCHVIEQLLLILNHHQGTANLRKNGPAKKKVKVLFTSLYSWHEIGLITRQHEAIYELNGSVLDDGCQLNLLYMNISFNALNKYPSPSEIGASIEDMNDECLIQLTADFWRKKGWQDHRLDEMEAALNAASELTFLKRQKEVLEKIDRFRLLKKELIQKLGTLPEDTAMLTLLTNEKHKGIDKLINLNVITDYLGYLHNKNCQNSIDRSAGANAADKAAYAFKKITHASFIPGEASEDQKSLFKVLYSMYLVWEEPEINAAMSTGFLGEKFYQNFFQKNPETTHYLIQWLKKHPEVYLGLSEYRS